MWVSLHSEIWVSVLPQEEDTQVSSSKPVQTMGKAYRGSDALGSVPVHQP